MPYIFQERTNKQCHKPAPRVICQSHKLLIRRDKISLRKGREALTFRSTQEFSHGFSRAILIFIGERMRRPLPQLPPHKDGSFWKISLHDLRTLRLSPCDHNPGYISGEMYNSKKTYWKSLHKSYIKWINIREHLHTDMWEVEETVNNQVVQIEGGMYYQEAAVNECIPRITSINPCSLHTWQLRDTAKHYKQRGLTVHRLTNGYETLSARNNSCAEEWSMERMIYAEWNLIPDKPDSTKKRNFLRKTTQHPSRTPTPHARTP